MKANFPAGEGGGGKSGLGKQAGQHGMILRQPVSHTVRKRGLGDSRLGILIVCKKRDKQQLDFGVEAQKSRHRSFKCFIYGQ